MSAMLDGMSLFPNCLLYTSGLHCHIGSQIFDIEPFEHAAQVMLTFIAQIKKETGLVIRELDLGGGFGIKYVPENDPVPYDGYMERVSKVVKASCQELGIEQPFIVIEPGRSIVGSAGITLYQVGSIKEIPGCLLYTSQIPNPPPADDRAALLP